jgi:hypothetical protein
MNKVLEGHSLVHLDGKRVVVIKANPLVRSPGDGFDCCDLIQLRLKHVLVDDVRNLRVHERAHVVAARTSIAATDPATTRLGALRVGKSEGATVEPQAQNDLRRRDTSAIVPEHLVVRRCRSRVESVRSYSFSAWSISVRLV